MDPNVYPKIFHFSALPVPRFRFESILAIRPSRMAAAHGHANRVAIRGVQSP
jgi:hypothetical protein